MVEGKTIEIYADTRGTATCRGRSCRAAIEWAEVVSSGKRMCFNAPVVALRTRHDEGQRLIEVVALDSNHWGSCPDTAQFKTKAAR